MSAQSNNTVFLERKSYRRRRLLDAARALPVLGVILLMLPLLWSVDDGPATSNADAMLYMFAVWCLLVILASLISRALRPNPPAE